MKGKSWLILLLFISASLAGCLENFSESSISLVVSQEDTEHKIVRVIEEGQLMKNLSLRSFWRYRNLKLSRPSRNWNWIWRRGLQRWWAKRRELDSWSCIQPVWTLQPDRICYRQRRQSREFILNQSINLEIRWSEEETNEPTDIEFDPVPAQGSMQITSWLIRL